jgi:selenocysteine lyase/cysteine desulfurase
MGASLDLLHALGPCRIEARVLSLAARCADILRDCGAEVEHADTPIVTACLPGGDAAAFARRLKAQRIVVSARHGRLRVSTHFYNDESDLERLGNALQLADQNW